MANVPPAAVTITSTVGPGLSAVANSFTNVVNLEYDFAKNTVKVTHAGGRLISYYDYSAIVTVTHTISGGATTVTITT